MPGRTLAIGDIHGCHVALEVLLEQLRVQPDDTVVIVGDVVDRGPGTRQSIELLLDLQVRAKLVFIMGNHEEMMLDAIAGGELLAGWLRFGGQEAVLSYGADIADIPAEHVAFLRSSVDYYESDTDIFVHANLEPGVPLEQQQPEWLRWTRLTGFETRHVSGKRVLCGHTPQVSGLPAAWDGWVCLDTWAYHGLFLTCLDASTNTVYQSRQTGEFRIFALEDLK